MMKKITPMSQSQFEQQNTASRLYIQNEYDSLFSAIIEQAYYYAIGPIFYNISSFNEFHTKFVSDNIHEMTPLSKEEWLEGGESVLSIFHPEDSEYVIAAMALAINTYKNTELSSRDMLRFNIYSRMQNAKKEYRWTLMQSWFLINELNEVELGLHIYHDLSHLQIVNRPLLSVFDYRNAEVQYFRHIDNTMNKIKADVPSITKREKEILILMAQGANSPEISDKLFISYHTVENHKRNLRHKTNTKTSTELIAFVLKFDLLWL